MAREKEPHLTEDDEDKPLDDEAGDDDDFFEEIQRVVDKIKGQ